DGSNRKKLASMRGLGTGDWSQDGSMVGFETALRGKAFVARTDGGAVTELPVTTNRVTNVMFSFDGKLAYIAAVGKIRDELWQAKLDGSPAKKLAEGFSPTDATPDGKYLLGTESQGDRVGIYQLSIADNKIEPLLPIVTFLVRASRDGKSLLYTIAED